MKVIRLAFLTAVTICLMKSALRADGVQRQPTFTDSVHDVTDAGLIVFESHGTYRIWGALVDPESLRAYIVGRKLRCFSAGSTQRNLGSVKVITCNISSWEDPELGDLGRALISANIAREICSETINFYGTCD
jgi:hypothetical protein